MAKITLKPTDIVIPGRIITSSSDKKVAESSLICDSSLGKSLEEINNEKVYRVEIWSTDGIILNSPELTTTLYAQVFVGNDNITETIHESNFNWVRHSTDQIDDDHWAQNPDHQGVRQIVVTYDDIDKRAVFDCEVNIE